MGLVSPDLNPDSLGVRSIRTISRSIRVTLGQRLLSQCEEYKYSSSPLTHSLSCSFWTRPSPNPRTSSLTPSLWFLRDFLRDSSERLAREEIRASEHPFQPLSTSSSSSPRIQVLLLLELWAPRRLGVLVSAQAALWAPQKVCKLYSSLRNP